IAASDDGPKKFMERVKNKEDGVRLMGFGHRVYKNYDPRAKIIKKTADEVLARSGGDPLLELAQQLEEIALADDYFVERKLSPIYARSIALHSAVSCRYKQEQNG